ncbi:CcdB family protein [Rhizobium sp. Root482]|uniref:CcdB family protein n=1 Tax=Rhizobium sp. Root482 TaxID=1736543 RepID=UPI0006FC9F2C|nr:CcdB family protein [Rhizobium sp. Root482]KQY12685.1 pirin [Rhizobium sp. Root482]
MARFHVYRLKPDGVSAIDLQANILSDLPSRLMAPLYPVAEMSWSISRLNPRFIIGGELHAMATQRMAAIPISEIGAELADLSARSDDIIAATDFLFQGF